ncbi:MAG: LLM class flavin-dependent oxidoreductase [Euryarchaeota archaeon]|nr:LLM class flavin-dependent oxidoreductase [Euryarchaeota archaeon]
MKLSLGLTTGMPVARGVELARLAEQQGYYRVFVGEDVLSREIFTYLSIIAVKTRMPVASGILSPYLRSLALIASATAGLQLITGNRFSLGLGVGGIPEVKRLTGEEPRNAVEVLRESAEVIRRIFRGEEVTYEGRRACLRNYRLRVEGVAVPEVLFGVRGRRLLALAGEVSDGVIFSGPNEYLKRAIEVVRRAAERAGRDFGELRRVVWKGFVLGKAEKARVVAATMIASSPEEVLRMLELEQVAREIRRALLRRDYSSAASLVPQEALEEYCFCGTREEILDAMEELRRAGFEEFVVGPPFGKSPEEVVRSFG